MRSSRMASAALAPVFLAALLVGCGGTSGTGSGPSADCGSGHHVEVVVELASGKVVDSCVSFKGAELAAETAMAKSRIEYATKHFSFGDAVCQIDDEPRAYSDCFGSGQPYWELFTWTGKGPWKAAVTGISDIELRPGDGLGWHYGSGTPGAPPKPPKAS